MLGIAGIAANLERLMNSILDGFGVVLFLDDILDTGYNRTDHLQKLEPLFARLQSIGFFYPIFT